MRLRMMMDEVCGLGWRLFVDGRSKANRPTLESGGIQPFLIGGEGLRETDGLIAAWFDRHQCEAAIVRPDHYVYCGLPALSDFEEIREALQKEVGWQPSVAHW